MSTQPSLSIVVTPATGSDATRQKITDAARRVFAEKGYERTSTDAVAAAAPVSKRTLYNHFESKEALFQAVIMSSWSWLLSPSAAKLLDVTPETYDDAYDALISYGVAVEAHWSKPGVVELIRLVIAEAHRFPEIAEAFLKHGKEPAVNRLSGFLTRVHKAGLAEIREPKINAWQFHGMLKETIFLPNALGITLPFTSEKLIKTAVESTLGTRRVR
jgi:TetR/AcrR family transcriptional regulator of autoinduction and epiphytic fitness